ncbi:GPW/gp25 family protein [Embleya sp. NPDC059259]|uniref:GPW/gp25 family protein n=1 Tax=unclassified Embleya TaxID=2699296 RepID=UPI0036926E37
MDIIGSGWPYPAAITPDGRVALVSGPTDVEEAIRIILETTPGERAMRPEFGCAIHTLTFDPLDAGTVTAAELRIREALDRWEPRIEVHDVAFSLQDQESGTLYLDIAYRLRATNEPRNLVFPYYTLPPAPDGPRP